jgi:hypothetical protein
MNDDDFENGEKQTQGKLSCVPVRCSYLVAYTTHTEMFFIRAPRHVCEAELFCPIKNLLQTSKCGVFGKRLALF